MSRSVEGKYADLIRQMNQDQGIKIAVDIPSGVSADSGAVLGCAFRADYTVTFQDRKIGLLLDPGRGYAGAVEPRRIGICEEPLAKDPHTAITLGEERICGASARTAGGFPQGDLRKASGDRGEQRDERPPLISMDTRPTQPARD